MSHTTTEIVNFSNAEIAEINGVKYIRQDIVMEAVKTGAINFGDFLRLMSPVGFEDAEDRWMILIDGEFHHKKTKEIFEIYENKVKCK